MRCEAVAECVGRDFGRQADPASPPFDDVLHGAGGKPSAIRICEEGLDEVLASRCRGCATHPGFRDSAQLMSWVFTPTAEGTDIFHSSILPFFLSRPQVPGSSFLVPSAEPLPLQVGSQRFRASLAK